MSTMLAYTRFEVLRTLRNARFLVLTMGMPAVLFLVFDQTASGFGAYLMVAMTGFSMISATISANCVTLPAERASGWQRQLRITPLSGAGWVTARIAQATVAVLPGLAVVALCGVAFGHVELSAVQWVSFGLLVVAASIPFSFLGLLLGQVLDAQAAQPVQGLLTMLLSFGGGLFIPLSSFPSALRAAADVLPTHLFFAAGQDLLANRPPALGDVTGLATWSLGLAVLALLVWSCQSGRRLALAR
jgi:ABC-2 type transport system permease protein